MATVRLIDPATPPAYKMDRPCQITLEPHEAAAIIAIRPFIGGDPAGPCGFVYGLLQQIGHVYSVHDCPSFVNYTKTSGRGIYFVSAWPDIPGIVAAPKAVTP